MLDGVFVKCVRVKNNKWESKIINIKISEIKKVYDLAEEKDECCIFSIYKDHEYGCPMKANDLIDAISLFIFKPNEFYEKYMEKGENHENRRHE